MIINNQLTIDGISIFYLIYLIENSLVIDLQIIGNKSY